MGALFAAAANPAAAAAADGPAAYFARARKKLNYPGNFEWDI
jgi:hypothetical protein